MTIKRFQEGGAAPAAAPAPNQGGNEEQMMQQLAQMAQEIISQLGPDAAAMLAQIIMEMLQGASQEMGGAPQEQQFMRKGGKIEKACNGGKSVRKIANGKKLSR